MAKATSLSTGTPAATTAACSGLGQYSSNSGRANVKNTMPPSVIRPPPARKATSPLRRASTGLPAPRFWPTSTAAATPKASPNSSASDSQPSAIPWAPRAASPSPLTTERNIICPATMARLSAAAGRLTWSSRPSRARSGHKSRQESFRPDRPRASRSMRATAPPAWASPVPQAMPARPRPGKVPTMGQVPRP